jgi:hypothetical protein
LADFSDAIFYNARFFRAHFKQTAIFSQTTFNEGVDFLGTNFSKDAYFVGDNIHKCFEERCSFKGIKLDKDAELVFERVCLERATFLDANLERITFRDVDWHRASSRWMTRKQALSDEFEMLNGDELNKSIYEKISENYSQLVLNYEKRRDYNSAENFHIGEMELLRKKKCIEIKSNWWRKFRGGVNAYGVYRLSSNYGTSYVQAFIVFIILILLLAALFLYSGFYINVEKSAGEVRAVEYNVLPDSEHQTGTLSQWAYDYLSAVSLSISIVTFQKERFYQPMGGVSRFLFYIALVVLTAQATLILLAIRRRFKR